MESTHYISCWPSRSLSYLIALQGLLCLAAIFEIVIQNHIWLAILVLFLVVLIFNQLFRSNAWRLVSKPFELRLRRDFTISLLANQISPSSTSPVEVKILPGSRAFDFVIILELKLEDGQIFLFPLLFDTMDAQDFRRLKVRVFYALQNKSSNLAQNQHGK